MQSDAVLHRLAEIIASDDVGRRVSPMLSRVEAALAADPERPQAWETVPANLFGPDLPAVVRSCWVFVLRSGVALGAERHPNSHQRTVAWQGRASFEVLADGVWTARPLDSARPGPIAERWVSIPPGAWHRIQVGPENFLSVSFHTVPEAELVEETPVAGDLSVTRARRYRG